MRSTLSGEARLRDPAHRDQDGPVWRRDRFAERVRRQWNPVRVSASALDPDDLDGVAKLVQEQVGGDAEDILHRLRDFAELDEAGAAPAIDPLLRPGAPA